MSKLSIDTETTGVDHRHGAQPFFVTMTNDDEQTWFYEWPVDPYTRKVTPDKSDVREIKDYIQRAASWSKFDEETRERHVLILQNAKFDVRALKTIGITDWPWSMTRDTLIAAHLLYSDAKQEKHDLTRLAMKHLRINIKPLEDNLERVVKQCRAFVRSKKNVEKYKLGKWRIAKKGLPDMPSAKEKTWKFDSWLPKALATHLGYDDDHEWHTVLRDYGNADSMVTHGIWQVQKKLIEKKKLWKIFLNSMEMPEILYGMEERGLTVSGKNLKELATAYKEKSDEFAADCIDLADSIGHELTLPKGGAVNDSLRKVIFDGFGLERIKGKKSKTDNPSLDKYIMDHYKLTLPKQSKACQFVMKLASKRSIDTALSFLRAYRRFWLPLTVDGVKVEDWYKLYPNLNQTGTATTRFSSKNPNEQNVAKKDNFNLRYVFGPAPGREMWRLDYENLELRIPAYDAHEEPMIELFEQPDNPPYFGSNHLLCCHILHPKLFENCLSCTNCKLEILTTERKKDVRYCECGSKRTPINDGRLFKDRYKATWYSWTKNGNFAVQYGAQIESGTADRAYHVEGAQAQIQQRLGRIGDLNRRMIDMANRLGYVETMPDKTVDPERGYPLYAKRTGYGKVLPTTPLSYRVQGTAGWCARKAMIRCERQLRIWREERFDGYMDVQVHDELGFDFPLGGKKNLWRIEILKALMEKSGDDIGVPLKVDVSYHPHNWSKEGELANAN